MLTGHAYDRALQAHMLSAATLAGNLLETPNCLNEGHVQKLASLHDMLLNHKCLPKELHNENALTQLSSILDDLQQNEALNSRTGKLWIVYLKMVRLLLNSFYSQNVQVIRNCNLMHSKNDPITSRCWAYCLCKVGETVLRSDDTAPNKDE